MRQWRRVEYGGDMPSAERRADALRTEGRGWKGSLGGGVWWDADVGSASGAGAKRRAAMRDTGRGAK